MKKLANIDAARARKDTIPRERMQQLEAIGATTKAPLLTIQHRASTAQWSSNRGAGRGRGGPGGRCNAGRGRGGSRGRGVDYGRREDAPRYQNHAASMQPDDAATAVTAQGARANSSSAQPDIHEAANNTSGNITQTAIAPASYTLPVQSPNKKESSDMSLEEESQAEE